MPTHDGCGLTPTKPSDGVQNHLWNLDSFLSTTRVELIELSSSDGGPLPVCLVGRVRRDPTGIARTRMFPIPPNASEVGREACPPCPGLPPQSDAGPPRSIPAGVQGTHRGAYRTSTTELSDDQLTTRIGQVILDCPFAGNGRCNGRGRLRREHRPAWRAAKWVAPEENQPRAFSLRRRAKKRWDPGYMGGDDACQRPLGQRRHAGQTRWLGAGIGAHSPLHRRALGSRGQDR